MLSVVGIRPFNMYVYDDCVSDADSNRRIEREYP